MAQAYNPDAIVPSTSGKRKYTCHHCARFFCRDCYEQFILVSSFSTAMSSSNRETTCSVDGVGVGDSIGESGGEAAFYAPSGIKVCGECIRDLNNVDEKKSSHDDNEETEEELLVTELELLGAAKINLVADSADVTTTLGEEALEDNLGSE